MWGERAERPIAARWVQFQLLRCLHGRGAGAQDADSCAENAKMQRRESLLPISSGGVQGLPASRADRATLKLKCSEVQATRAIPVPGCVVEV